ncbi:hypothetical protein OH540_21130 [Streptomyces sp. BPPL-273]|uniref:hypothetical protein n=1 Tax=Streptomyces sp. BPPL-273 TaxID=2987533 RepID=UPI0024AFFBC0|nr:hypothetical protein [Streptomyces sp. BPPL-273]WHM32409.1 hypothetical protein OH540_21130 [Streptomyces sp. BPPL-273]
MTEQTTRHTSHGMRTQLVTTAADVISRAMQQGRTLPAALAVALDSARLLQSPDTAAEFEKLQRWHEEDGRAMEVGRQQRRNLRARIAELEAERHTANESLSDAAEQLRADRDRIAELEAARDQLVRWHGEDSKTNTTLVARVDRYRAELTALRNDALSMRGSLAPADGDRKVPFELGETLTPAVDWLIARVAELEAAQGTVYRAEHPDSGITLGHYSTAKAARDHCEATERRSWPTGTTLAFDWIEDDEDRVAELVVTAGQNDESATGYLVTALELDSEYDADADQ